MIKELIRKTGYEISKNRQNRFHYSYLSRVCQPKTVIDVGVGFGTYPLYKAYPTANFILIEPLRDYEGAHKRILKDYNCKICYKGLGNIEEKKEIIVDTNNLQLSSLKNRTSLTKSNHSLQKRQVTVTTLDNIFSENQSIEYPILLKIDTEGHELEVLEGAEKSLQVIDTVIAEISIAKRFENSYCFEDIINFMKKNGFQVFSFLDIVHPKKELRTRFAEILFKRV